MAKLFHLQHLFSFVIKAAYQVSEKTENAGMSKC